MKKLKLKKSAAISILLIITAAVICLVVIISNKGKTEPDNTNESQAQMVQDEGDLEIIIPEDQESDGF